MNCRNTSTRSRRTWGWLRSGLLGAALALIGTAQAQLNYSLDYFSVTYTPITTGGGATTSTAVGDGGWQGSIPIGFTFTYNGTPYTTFGVATDGYVSFTATSSSLSNTNLVTTTAPNAVLAPYWDDLNTNAVGTNPAGSILYQTTGAVGSRVLTVQWVNNSYYFGSGTTQPRQINYQVKLYETSNIIEFWYGAATGSTYSTSESASIGIKSQTGGDNQFICAVTGSSRVANTMLNSSDWPTVNVRFTPGAPTALPGGTYTVGSGGSFPNLTAALSAINRRGIAGAVTLNLTDATVSNTLAGGLNQFPLILGPVAGTSATNTITITSSVGTTITYTGRVAGNVSITASTAFLSNTSEGLLNLVGTDYVTVQNLNFTGVNSINPTRNVDRGIGVYNFSATDGATNNVVQSCTFNMDRTNVNTQAINQTVVIAPTAATGANSTNIYRNLTIRNTNKGITMLGNATWPDVGCQVTTTNCATRNSIGDPNVAGDIGNTATIPYGVQITNGQNFTVNNCDISNVLNTGGQADGINIVSFQGFCSVNNNKIRGVRNTGTASLTGISGIRATHTTTGNHTLRIFNNAISDITSGYLGAASATRVPVGIRIAGTGGLTTQTYDIWHNNVSIDGSASLNASSACIEFSTTSGPLFFVRNNVFANYTAAQPTPATTRHFGVVHTSATAIGNTGSAFEYNDVYIANDANVSGFTALGNATTFNGVGNWQLGTAPQTASNVEVNPFFVNPVTNPQQQAPGLDGAGFTPPPPYITNDLACATRGNDIGAYEFTPPPCFPVSGTVAVQQNCIANSDFFLNVTVTNLNFNTGVDVVSDYLGNPGGQTNVGVGSYLLGPFPSNTPVVVSLNPTGQPSCNASLGTFTYDCSTFGQNALSFDGVNDGVVCPNVASLDITGTQITLEAWIYPTAFKPNTFDGNIINKEGGFAGYQIRCGGAGILEGVFGTGAGFITVSSPANTLVLNQWQHVAVSYDGANARLYKDGVQVASVAGTLPFVTTPNAMRIGDYAVTPGARTFAGLIDEARVWAVARTAGEIASFRNQVLCGSETGLRAAYNFNQGDAGANNAGVTTLLDATANANNGTLQNFTLNGPSSNWVLGKTGLNPCSTGCSSAPAAGAINGNGSVCATVSNTLALVGAAYGPGSISFQWKYGPVGGPYTNLLGTGLTQNTNVIPAGSWEVVADVTCDAGPFTSTTAPFAVTIAPNATVTAAATNPACVGSPLDLTGTSDLAGTYSWTGPAGFTSSSLSPQVNASATTAMSGTYTLTATVGACTSNPATVAVTVNLPPSVSAVTATPSTICVGGNSQLQANGGVAAPVNAYSFSSSIGTFSSIFGQPGTVTITSANTDDTSFGPYTLPFSFVFNGTSFTQVGVQANGWVSFGATLPSNSYTALSSGLSNFVAAAFNADLEGDPVVAPGATMMYQVTGTAPNRVFTVEWRNWGFYSAGTDQIDFQIKLYETSNRVQYVYQNGPGTATGSVQVGLRGSSNAVFINRTTASDWSNTTAGAVNTAACAVGSTPATRPADGLTFNFDPPQPTWSWSPVTYLDNPAIANPLASGVLSSTTYTATATSNGCPATGTVTVNTSAPITAASITGNLGYCTGGSTTLTATPADGGAPFTYLWSPGGETTASIVVNTVGTYSCQVTDNCGGSVNTGNVNVVENPLPTVGVSPNAAPFCTGNTAVALLASGASTYSWAPPTGLSATTGASVNANPAATTTYTVTGTDGNGCVNTATTTITNNGLAPTIASVTATPPSVCSGANSQLQVNMAAPSAYCTGPYTTGTGASDYILSVVLGSINNSTGASGAPYNTYYSALSTTLTAGSPYTLTGTLNNGGTEMVAAWIDYDQNGTFDASEKLGEFTGLAYSIPFTVPVSALNGTTRMRVRNVYFTTGILPCQSYTYGEIEDYNVVITGGASLSYSWSPATYLDNTTITNPLASGVTTNETYTVTVTQGLCSSTGTVSVTLNTTDTDGDGTIDCIDGCPADPNKIAAGVCGCGNPDTDTDGDLTADCVDGCPADPNKIAAGACGCGNPDTDTDGDLTADCVDGCPNDPNKIAGGICGCGVADTDSDGDGTADCNDGCPADPNKIAAGLCGCGFGEPGASCSDGNPNTIFDTVLGDCSCVGQPIDCEGTPNGGELPGTDCNDNDVCTINDTWSVSCVCVGTFQDTDGDLTCDANDGCPNDPNKIAVGICGCGVADTDSDADGLADCIDPCPTLPILVNGDPCDDGNPCTINDVVTACACAGTPAPVTAGITASSTVYCTPGSGVTLTATGGDTYSWAPATGLSSTTGSPVTATPASTTTYTLTATNLAGCSDTETVTLTTGSTPATPIMSAQPNTALCPGGSSQLGATIGGGTPSYCIPALSTGCSFPDQISNVNVAGIVRASGCDNLSGSNGYSNFASPTGALVAGSTGNSYSITTSGDVEGAALWIDFNQNGTFENPAELIFNSYAGTNPATYTGTFSVPAGAINGNTRLRVRCTYAGAPGTNACSGLQTTYGETEDYTVNITGGAPNCAAGINFSWSPTTYLSNPLICNPLASGVMTATTYTVTATNAAGCSSTGTIAVNVETTDTDGDLTVDCLDGCPADPNKIAAGQCGCGVADTDTDGDLTADCNDGCPNDPNKIAAGICGCGVADTDTDGDATADCFDLCPSDPNKIVPGVCGCGAPDTDTDNDGVADCIDSCPLVSGVIGTACNDNNPATLNDALDANCVCTGSTLSCPDQSVVLDLTTDNSGAQTSWDIVNVGTNNVQCSGSGYLNNQSVSIGCCLATGCYELRVFDSAGDGMANGTIGGYVLRLPNGTRIIDNGGDGIFTFTSQIANNLGFCVPLGTNSVIPAHCDKANWLPNEVIQAQVNAAVTAQFGVTNSTSGYQFWFFSPDGGYTRRVLQTHAAPGVVTGAPSNVRAAYLDLSSITTSPLPLYTNLNVRIRVQIAGVFSEWGPACRFRIDPPCATTQLTTSANPVVSCGATGLTFASTIYANNVAGANRYQFEFSRAGYLRRIASTTRSQVLNWVTNPLQNNTCYNVRVRVSFDGGTTYCAFGPTCTVTVGTAFCNPAMPTQPETFTDATETGRLTVFPNPNNGDQVTLVLTSFDRSVNNIQVDVNDIYGKFITRRNIAVQDGYMNTVLSFEQELAPGMYLLNLQAGEQRFTQRMIVQ